MSNDKMYIDFDGETFGMGHRNEVEPQDDFDIIPVDYCRATPQPNISNWTVSFVEPPQLLVFFASPMSDLTEEEAAEIRKVNLEIKRALGKLEGGRGV